MSDPVEKPARARKSERAAVTEEKKTNGNGNGKAVYAEFDKLVSEKKGTKAAIFTHRCPDPDAIGSMMGMSWLLLRKYGIESKFFFSGEVSHPQNNTMCNLLDPGLIKVEHYKPEEYGIRIVVDTVPANAGTDGETIPFDVMIDHHRDIPLDFTGIIISRKVGSCSAVVFEMISTLVNREEIWFDDDVDLDVKVATALIVGVYTDTNFLSSDDSTETDRMAFNELFEYRNSNYLHQIAFFKRPKYWIDKKAAAVSAAKVEEEGWAIVGLGVIPECHRDLIADMAEDMVKWLSVQTAISFAVIGGDRIEGSVRSLNASLSVPELCKKLGGETGSGGGKIGRGAYRITLSPKIDLDEEDEEDITEAWESIRRRELKRIARIIKK